MTTKQERRAATLEQLHDNTDPVPCVDLDDAVVQMAIRYATARVLQVDRNLDYELTDRARSRRFAAMCRLVNALKHQQS